MNGLDVNSPNATTCNNNITQNSNYNLGSDRKQAQKSSCSRKLSNNEDKTLIARDFTKMKIMRFVLDLSVVLRVLRCNAPKKNCTFRKLKNPEAVSVAKEKIS